MHGSDMSGSDMNGPATDEPATDGAHGLFDPMGSTPGQAAALQTELLGTAGRRHARRGAESAGELMRESGEAVRRVSGAMVGTMAGTMTGAMTGATANAGPAGLPTAWAEYARDAGQRGALFADLMRRRADIFEAHRAAGMPPVLAYDHEVVMEARAFERRPCNYRLLRITPPDGVEVMDWKRPYVIIDPRAGHGAGIGGFKPDSQVGVALADGHPVYFVAFHPEPVEGQTIADVAHAEGRFLRRIGELHPDAPAPVVVGNCQGGWGAAIMAATYPDAVGPLVLNGAPMSYWGGKLGQDPMRYLGGLQGGALPALMTGDLGGGTFDGANLVMNFEALNPGRTWWRKYADMYADPDKGVERFLEFERWWGGFYLMTTREIRWIVENLFVGNRLSRNMAQLEPGRPIDLKVIRTPIIVFASHGDNITPPAQALNWIVDTYADESEIAIRGQRIVYMIHEEVGHLGIFVSSSVARREHGQIVSTLKTIEALPPGLYEMRIADHAGEGHGKTFEVDFAARTMGDVVAATGPRRDEAAFAGVARASEALVEAYETTLRPAVRAMSSPALGAMRREANPMRTSRAALATGRPGMAMVEAAAERARSERAPADPENPFLLAERATIRMIESAWDVARDLREAALEVSFYAIWASPWALWYGAPNGIAPTRKSAADLRALPEVRSALAHMREGGPPAGIVRMLVLLAEARGDVRQDRLVRSSELLTTRPPFDAMTPEARRETIHRQTLIAEFAPDEAIDTLVDLLPDEASRQRAVEAVAYVLGEGPRAPAAQAMLERMGERLDVTFPAAPVAPKAPSKASNAPAADPTVARGELADPGGRLDDGRTRGVADTLGEVPPPPEPKIRPKGRAKATGSATSASGRASATAAKPDAKAAPKAASKATREPSATPPAARGAARPNGGATPEAGE